MIHINNTVKTADVKYSDHYCPVKQIVSPIARIA